MFFKRELCLLVGFFLFLVFVNFNMVSAAYTNVSSCQNITVSGGYIINETLTSLSSNCININASNVFLEGSGNLVSASIANGSAIRIIDVNNVTINNVTLRLSYYGLLVENATNYSTFSNIMFYDNNQSGFYANGTVKNSNFSNNYFNGSSRGWSLEIGEDLRVNGTVFENVTFNLYAVNLTNSSFWNLSVNSGYMTFFSSAKRILMKDFYGRNNYLGISGTYISNSTIENLNQENTSLGISIIYFADSVVKNYGLINGANIGNTIVEIRNCTYENISLIGNQGSIGMSSSGIYSSNFTNIQIQGFGFGISGSVMYNSDFRNITIKNARNDSSNNSYGFISSIVSESRITNLTLMNNSIGMYINTYLNDSYFDRLNSSGNIHTDLKLINVYNTEISDSFIKKYNFTSENITGYPFLIESLKIKSSSKGSVSFVNITRSTGESLTGYSDSAIKLNTNSIFVNSSYAVGLNGSTNMIFYGISGSGTAIAYLNGSEYSSQVTSLGGESYSFSEIAGNIYSINLVDNSTSSSSSSGGGSSNLGTISSSSLSSGYEKSLYAGGVILFKIKQKNSSLMDSHTLIVDRVNKDSVDLTLRSDPIKFSLNQGQYRDFDLGGESLVRITALEIKNGYVKISVKEENFEINTNEISTSDNSEGETSSESNTDNSEDSKNNEWILWVVITVILVCGAVVAYYYLQKKS